MNFNFKLLLNSKLPENGFSLDELVVATKEMFEQEGMVGFLRVLLEIIDQALYLSCIGPNEHKCCDSCYFVKDRKEIKNIITIGGVPIPHQRLHRWVTHSDCDQIDMKKKVQTLISDGTGYKKKPVHGSNRGEVRLVVGVTKDNLVVPYGAWTEESWRSIGQELKQANHPTSKTNV